MGRPSGKSEDGKDVHALLIQTGHDLVLECDPDDITVGMICDKAGVSRQTFYNYFANKYDVLNEYCMMQYREDLFLVGRTYTWDEASLLVMRRIARERDLYFKIMESKNLFESFYPCIIRNSMDVWSKTVTEYNGLELTPELDFQITFWAQAVSWTIKHRLDGTGLTPEQVSTYFCHCRPELLTRAMDDPVLERRRKLQL